MKIFYKKNSSEDNVFPHNFNFIELKCYKNVLNVNNVLK